MVHPDFGAGLIFSPKPVLLADYSSLNLNYSVNTNLDEKRGWNKSAKRLYNGSMKYT